ncbi:reverse transcriptase [Lasius niger]|uniref:Reverse transcriptase n=1 Tax=Lasius niger TaxID=67767 RepID=A0A0J7KLK2_LASNI|nr:reverse transcriptase [Lasius niger]
MDQDSLPESETGKIFEKILVDRLNEWLRMNPIYQLSDNQFGFREGKSTCDALTRVQDAVNEAIDQDGVVVAVSLDIKNAFNSLPWPVIREALRRKRVPEYIRRIIDHYLRSVEYVDKKGQRISRSMQAGVPQGSVLGPTLWNVCYDSVLQEGANLQTALVVNRIKRLGLTVSANKTEAVLFYGRRNKPKDLPSLIVDGEIVQTRPSMKYLGVILDSKMLFREHLNYIETKVAKVTKTLGRLMPNLRGPKERKRKLYANVILSIILYAAPIWCDAMSTSKNRTKLDRLVRMVNIRVAAAYRTVSLEAASIMVRIPPLHLLAALRRRVYLRVADLRSTKQWSKIAVKEIKEEETLIMRRQWEFHIGRPNLSGVRVREAVLPIFNQWLDGRLTFHMTQIISGHGCFGSYLFRIVMRAICLTLEAWAAFSQLCGAVMLEKESRKRERQAREAQMIAAQANGSNSQHDDD